MADGDITVEILKDIRGDIRGLRDEVRGELRGVRDEIRTTNQRLDATNERLETMNGRLETMNERLDITVQRLDVTNQRLGVVESTVLGMAEQQRFLVRLHQRARGARLPARHAGRQPRSPRRTARGQVAVSVGPVPRALA